MLSNLAPVRFAGRHARHGVVAAALGILTLSGTAYASHEPVAAKGAPGVSPAAVGCDTGTVHSFARIKGTAAGFPNIYTTSSTFIDHVRNCGGGAVSVRRASAGVYLVRFTGDPAILALAQNNADGRGTESVFNDNIVTVAFVTDTDGQTSFRVEVQDVCGDCSDGADPQDGQLTILVF